MMLGVAFFNATIACYTICVASSGSADESVVRHCCQQPEKSSAPVDDSPHCSACELGDGKMESNIPGKLNMSPELFELCDLYFAHNFTLVEDQFESGIRSVFENETIKHDSPVSILYQVNCAYLI
jgi:hypothetical protein